jgi:ketosteroid isomerase-like protein
VSEENVDLVRRAVAAFNRPDLEGLAEVVSPEWVLDWSQSEGPQKGVYEGLEEATEWMKATQDAFESFQVEPVEYLDFGDRIILRAQVGGRGRGSGVEVNAKGTTLWEIRDGRVTRMTLFQSDEEALAAVKPAG